MRGVRDEAKAKFAQKDKKVVAEELATVTARV
jgi:hypothetical protein